MVEVILSTFLTNKIDSLFGKIFLVARPSGRGWIKNGKALAEITCAAYYSCLDISAKALQVLFLVPDLKVGAINPAMADGFGLR
jgi:hypothetical protein